jgi:4-hydroxy-tetrahydrodipicolinate reductase
MGKGLVAEVLRDSQTILGAVLEHAKHPDQGKDMAILTDNESATGVVLSSSLADVITNVDVMIDFSSLQALPEHLELAALAGKGIVIGTTGLTDADKRLLDQAGHKTACLFSPNMSVGVNLLFKIVGEVAKSLGSDYDIEIIEKHHNKKKDAPSGTAIRLGEVIAEATKRVYAKAAVHGREGMTGERTQQEIGMHAVRVGGIVGEHTVIYGGEAEVLEITHRAQSRDAFILGALRGAKFLAGKKPGLYSMADVLKSHCQEKQGDDGAI